MTTVIDAGSEREEIAAIVNLMWDAVESRDGEQACALLTRRAQGYMTAFLRQDEDLPLDTVDEEDCARAVEDQDSVTDNGFTYTSDGVSIPSAKDHRRFPEVDAYAGCEFRGSVRLARAGESWKVTLPACVD